MGVRSFVGDTNNNGNGGGNGGNGGGNGGGMPPMGGMGMGGGTGMSSFDPNSRMTNLNLKCKTATKTLFRDAIILQLESILIGENKSDALLIGPAGVGKTKVVEELARWIASNDDKVPSQLKDFTIWNLQLSDIVAGGSFVGDVEQRVAEIVDYLSDKKHKAIVFIDEIHLLYGDDRQYQKIAQILKPAMSRNEIKVIGATTTQEAKDLDTDPAFNRRFTRVIVDELSKEQTVEILKSYNARLIQHYKLDPNTFKFRDELAMFIVNEADDFCSAGSHRPDNALTLFDRTVGWSVIQNNLDLHSNDPNRVAAAKALGVRISEKLIHETAFKITTGNNEVKSLDVVALREKLNRIKGQDDVIEQLIKIIKHYDGHIRPSKKPLTMLFAGASGVGKTEIVKILSQEYRGEKPIILNMTEYTDHTTINKIIGAPAAFVGYDSNAELPFDILDTNPYQIILLDEFEKAHRSVQRLFMAAMDEGFIKTNRGKTIDFSKSIIIATTNAACTTGSGKVGFIEESHEKSIEDLSAFFDVELLTRFKYRFTFHEITRSLFKEIMAEHYVQDVADIKSRKGARIPLDDTLSDEVLEELADKYFDPKGGARPCASAVEEYVDNILIDATP